jgi:hypothetical protein
MADELTGRALDVAIHRGLFGKDARWLAGRESSFNVDPAAPFGFTVDFGGAEFGSDRDWHVDEWYDDAAQLPVPEYSASWAGAGLVVEEMHPKQWRLLLHDCPDGWSAIWVHETEYTACRHSVSEMGSAPEAICRAALLALATPPPAPEPAR